MSTYVMSDIHGCYTEYMEMLEKIKFDPKKDEVIIAGDIVDRGPENLEMLRYMESEPESVTFLMGNHDYDFIGYCRGVEIMCDKGDGEWCNPSEAYLYRKNYKPSEAYHNKKYYDYFSDDYGTVKKLITGYDELMAEDFTHWKQLMCEFPYYAKRTINGRNYIIVHAGYIDETDFHLDLSFSYPRGINEFYIWARDDAIIYGGAKDSTIVFGHTPTIFPSEIFYSGGRVWYDENPKKNCRFFNIDCGLVYGKYDGVHNANLACIRLDDEKVFYLYGDM